MDFSALDPMAWLRKLAEKSPDTPEERTRRAQEAILGTLDATAAMGSGLLNQAIGGAVAAPWMLIPGETKAADVLASVSGALPAYAPRTEYGREVIGALGAPGGLGEKIDAPFRWVGDKANDASNAMGLPADIGGLAGSLAYSAANLVGPVEVAGVAKALPGIVKNAAMETAMAGATSPVMTLRVPKPDLDAYQTLRNAGKSDVEAFRETGVFEDAMGQLRKWHSDADMELLPDQGATRTDKTKNELYTRTLLGDRVAGYPLLEVYQPDNAADLPLYYREGIDPTGGGLSFKGDPINGGRVPSQMQIGVGRGGLPDQSGGLPAGEIVKDERLTIAHEGQHAADMWDGLQGGASPQKMPVAQAMLDELQRLKTLRQRYTNAAGAPNHGMENAVQAIDRLLQSTANQIYRSQVGQYKTNWGEAIARAGERILETGARTPQELLNHYPSGPMGALDVDPKALWQGDAPGPSAKITDPMYHGTSWAGFDQFEPTPFSFFTPDRDYANQYATGMGYGDDTEMTRAVLMNRLAARKPLDLGDLGQKALTVDEFVEALRAKGVPSETLGKIRSQHDEWMGPDDAKYVWQYLMEDEGALQDLLKSGQFDSIRQLEGKLGPDNVPQSESFAIVDPSLVRPFWDEGLEDVGAAKGPRETLAPSSFKEVDPQSFDQQLAAARQAMEAGGDKRSALQVDASLPADFKGKVYMTPDGLAGFAVSDSGYVSNLFKHPSAQYSDVMGAVLQRARDVGGKTLDAFDTGLAAGYGKRGAVETGRSPWNPEYAPQGWDEKTMGTPDYVAMALPSKKAWEQIQKIRGMSPEHADFINNALKYLTPAEWERLNAKTIGKLRGFMGDMTSVDDLVNMAFAGKAKKGWYRESAEAIQRIFGEDSERFTGLLAALSPQTSVESNLENALRVWGAWKQAGSPTDDASLIRILAENVQSPSLPQRSRAQLEQMSRRLGIKFRKGTKKATLISRIQDFERLSPQNAQKVKEMSILPAWTNNSLRALKSQGGLRLSGPKVDSFMRNLLGDLNEVTNDTWQAKALNVMQKFFGGQAIKAGGEKLGAKGPGYLAGNIQTRQAAEQLTKITGESWTPAEVQETVWSFVKALSELADESKLSLEDAWQHPDFTNQRVAGIPDFGTLMRTSPRYSRILEDAGYADKLKELQIHLSDRFVGEAAEGTPRTLSGGADRELARRLERGRQLNAKGVFE